MAEPVSASAVRKALAPWGLETARHELISHSENIVYKVISDENQFILRIHRPGYNSFNELESERIWADALNTAGIHTPTQRKTPDGDCFVEVEVGLRDTRAVGLMEWLDGHQLAESSEPRAYESLGILLARLHNHASAWRPPSGFQRRSWDADGLMGTDPLWGQFWRSPALSREESEFLEFVRKAIHSELANLPVSSATYGLIHADLHPHNVLVQGNDLYAIDFDDCGYGWHYYDIAVALHQVRNNDQFTALQRSLLQGYRSLRPMPDAEMLLSTFYLVRSLVGLGWISARPELATTDEVKTRVKPIIDEARAWLDSMSSG